MNSPESIIQMSRHEHRVEAKHLLLRATTLHMETEGRGWSADETARRQRAVANTTALANVHALLSLEDQ